MPPLKGEAARRGEGVLLKGEQRPEITKTINERNPSVSLRLTAPLAQGSRHTPPLQGEACKLDTGTNATPQSASG